VNPGGEVLRSRLLAMTPKLRTGHPLESLGGWALGAFLGVATGCATLPTVTFTGEEAGASDATLPPEGDGASSSSDGGAHSDAGDADAGNALACLPANPPPNAACCSPTMPCAGIACSHCNDCSLVKPACTPSQYCCAEVNGNSGKYKGVSCSANGANCP
jgi:hypothetical protein